jgi:hypothetical protein
MIKLEEFVNEKLRVSSNTDISDTTLYEQGYGFTSVNSVYSDIYQADDFIFSDLNLQELGKLQTAINYTNNNRVVIYDKPFQALKRRKYCQAIGNIILSENSFDDAMEVIQSVLKKNATCEYEESKSKKHVVVKIKDSYNIPAIVMTFNKL